MQTGFSRNPPLKIRLNGNGNDKSKGIVLCSCGGGAAIMRISNAQKRKRCNDVCREVQSVISWPGTMEKVYRDLMNTMVILSHTNNARMN